jgi:hypothetical protein
MILRAVLVLSALLASSAPARAADYASPAYDAKAVPLDDLCREMLTGNGYELRDDGVVWDKIGEAAVTRDDMPYLLSRLASARRLRALLQLNNIITRYDAERKLTPEDREAVRAIVRQNWVVFGPTPRRDFRSYFSVEELETLDKIPSRFDSMAPVTMTDPSTDSPTADAPAVAVAPAAVAPAVIAPAVVVPAVAAPAIVNPAVVAPVVSAPVAPAVVVAPIVSAPAAVAPAVAAPVAVAAAPVAAAPAVAQAVAPAAAVAAAPVAAPAAAPVVVAAVTAPMKVVPTLTPMMDMPSLKRDSPFGPQPPLPFVAAPAAPPPVATAVALPPPIAAPPPPTQELGVAKAWTPPPAVKAAPPVAVVSTATTAVAAVSVATAPVAAVSAATAAVAAAPVAPPPPPEPPKPHVLDDADYEKFVAEGPYTKDGRALLDLIGKRAPSYCLPLLRRTVVNGVPQIAFDGARTGSSLRAAFFRDPAAPLAPPVVVLSPGPVLVVKKSGLFGGRSEVVIPESPSAWLDLGAVRPLLDAFAPDRPVASTENGDWGAVRVYADGSRRGAYSQVEQAGELLEQLLLLGLAREGLDASPYAARRWARTARLMFSARMKDEMRQDGFLDPDRRAELRMWLDRPEEADDDAVAAWAGSRVQLYDPRRGPPDAERLFEARGRAGCVRATLESALVDAARQKARRVGALETLVDAGALDSSAAKTAAQAASDAEADARKRLLAAPPACAPVDPKRDEALKKSSLLVAEAARAERVLREHNEEGLKHAL